MQRIVKAAVVGTNGGGCIGRHRIALVQHLTLCSTSSTTSTSPAATQEKQYQQQKQRDQNDHGYSQRVETIIVVVGCKDLILCRVQRWSIVVYICQARHGYTGTSQSSIDIVECGLFADFRLDGASRVLLYRWWIRIVAGGSVVNGDASLVSCTGLRVGFYNFAGSKGNVVGSRHYRGNLEPTPTGRTVLVGNSRSKLLV